MPSIGEVTDAMTAMPVDVSEESSLQVSTTSPEQIVPSTPARALHVKKSNTKDSSSRSSSHSSSKPPTGRSSRDSHRGPGSFQDNRAIELHRDQNMGVALHDQRSLEVHNYDQRSVSSTRQELHQCDQRAVQVNVGVDPEQVIAREAEILSQAHAAVNAARSQCQSETSAMRNQVDQAVSHSHNVEARASELVNDMQVKHQRELDHVQQVANEAFRASQEQLHQALADNHQLMEQLKTQGQQLQSQRNEQQELRSVITGLQEQVRSLRSSPQPFNQNGAGHDPELIQVITQLRNEVRMLQSRPTIPVIAQPPVIPLHTPPEAFTPVSAVSACAGYQYPTPAQQPAGYPGSPAAAGWVDLGNRNPKGPGAGVLTASTVTAKPPGSPKDSDSSSSLQSGGGGRGGGGPGSPYGSFGGYQPGSPRGRSVGIGSNALGYRMEKDIYRSKDLSLVKIDHLPTSAADFRSWKNMTLTRIAAIDQTGRDMVLSWLLECFSEGRELDEFMHSGLLPRLDTHIGSLMMESKHLKGELGMKFQTYTEACQNACRAPRGRAFLHMISQHFRLDLNRGSNLTQQALLDLTCDDFSAKGLETFVHKIEYVLNAIPQARQPSEITRFTWLYSRVKKCRLLQRHIDRIRDSSETSRCRSWEWLMGKIKATIAESREDTNEDSIRASLQAKAKTAAKAVVAQDAEDQAKGLLNPSAKPTAKPKAAAPLPKAGDQGGKGSKGGQPTPKGDNPKGKAKGKGADAKKEQQTQAQPKVAPKAGDKSSVACLFWPKGTCNRGDCCPFRHDGPDPKAAAAAKPKAAAPARAKATVALLSATGGVQHAASLSSCVSHESSHWSMFQASMHAIVRPFLALMSFLSGTVEPQDVAFHAPMCVPWWSNATLGAPAVLHHEPQALIAQSNQSRTQEIEWIADSGAGRDLGSQRAFLEQGLSRNSINTHTVGTAPIRFETGNGTYTSSTCVELEGSTFGQAKYSMMDDCPIVRSLGQIVSSGRPFVWMPDQLPFFANSTNDVQIAADESQIHYANRVDDFVPIFKETLKTSASRALAGPEEIAAIEVEPAADEPEPPLPPPEVPAGGSDADSEAVDEEPLPRAQRLQAEARSIRHRMSHIPKNPYCDVCKRAGMYRRKVTRHRHDPLADRGALEEVTKFGQRIAADFIIVSKSHKEDKEAVVLVIRDEFSGYMQAFPCVKRSQDVIVKSVLAFLGPTYYTNPTIMCKTDCAAEFSAACNTLGFVHEPSLARRFPHNSVMEREIRTLEEITRAAHLGAGFHVVHDLWQRSVQYAAVVMNAHHPMKDGAGVEHNRHKLASDKDFEGRELVLGQLVYVRKDPLNRHKFAANAVPALFAGYRYDHGPKSYKGVYLTLDYQAIKDKSPGHTIATSVPCEELYIPPGDPVIPLHAAAEAALADLSNPELVEYLPKEVPFSSLPVDAPVATRHQYITLDRIIRFGATPDCKACSDMKGRHSARCRIRFDSLVKAEKAARHERIPEPSSVAAEPSAPEIVSDHPVGAASHDPARALAPADDASDAHHAEEPVGGRRDDLPFSAGIPPGDPESAALINRVASTIDQDFAQSSVERAKRRRTHSLPGANTLFEFARSDDSIIGTQAERIGATCIRLSRSVLDLCDPEHVQQAIGQLETMPGADAWASVTCTHHSPIQNLNIHMHGKPYLKKLNKRRNESETLLQYAIQFLERALELGGRIAFELPAENQLWNHPQWLAFEKRACLRRVYFHGCAPNLKGKHGKFLKKPWCIATSDLRLIQFFSQRICSGNHEHEESLGKNASQSAFYAPEFANVLLEAWYPQNWYKNVPKLDSASALVTLNLSRSVWLQDEKGLEAVRKEALGLRSNGTWDDSSVIPVRELRKKSRQQGTSIKLAEVLTLCGVKHYEMSPEHHKYKGRIVYRGDAIRDENHQRILFEDTATTPTALAALNLTLWWGCVTTLSCADCIQAYLQCDLDDCTWVILPFELWLEEWKQKYDKNEKLAVRLVRSLYGHPLAGNLWQQRLEKVVKSMGGEPIPSYASNFVFRRGNSALLLNIYVDDCTLAGGTVEIQQKFWEELRLKVKLEPEEFIGEQGTKILGRLHTIDRTPKITSMTYDMKSYTQGIIDLYCELTGTLKEKLRSAVTPCLPESSLSDADFEREGALHKHAARILMRCLWLSRLARPDISFAVGRLATRVTKWTVWEDRQTLC